MNKEERVELVFETISKIVGFEVKPNKDFYIWENRDKIKYHIRSDLTLMFEYSKGVYEKSEYTVLPILNGGYKLEEIKEPLTTEEERDFLRHFKFDELEKISTYLNMYDNNNRFVAVTIINLINLSFNGLEEGKKYSGERVGTMKEEKSFKITELVDQLIGSVSFNGDSYYDAISLDNLDNLEDVVIELVIKLSKLCELKDDYRYSAQLLAKKAFAIVDNLLSMLNISETNYYKVVEKEY